jgi:hypothetical protein
LTEKISHHFKCGKSKGRRELTIAEGRLGMQEVQTRNQSSICEKNDDEEVNKDYV